MTEDFLQSLYAISRVTKYPPGAFLFVHRGLDFTVTRIHGEVNPEAPAANYHVDGRTLCLGLRDYAIAQYGLMARTVLRRWNITSCEDFGAIVFAMVDAGAMSTTESDSIRDFAGAFSFDEAFTPALELNET